MRDRLAAMTEPGWAAVDDYFARALVDEDDALATARESSTRTALGHIEVSPAQGAFLALLTQIAGARRVLEFGTLVGYSATWFARAVGAGGRVVTLELDGANAAIARENWERAGVAGRVEVIVGPAADSAQRLIDAGTEPFDLVFIDADKPNNPVYVAAALQLTRPGAVIVIDNVVRRGEVANDDTHAPDALGVRAAVDAIAAHPDLDATALQTVGIKGWDGIVIARRR